MRRAGPCGLRPPAVRRRCALRSRRGRRRAQSKTCSFHLFTFREYRAIAAMDDGSSLIARSATAGGATQLRARVRLYYVMLYSGLRTRIATDGFELANSRAQGVLGDFQPPFRHHGAIGMVWAPRLEGQGRRSGARAGQARQRHRSKWHSPRRCASGRKSVFKV